MKTKNNINHAVILMAGKGTRFLPATKIVAKEMFPIGNKTAIMYLLKECLESGVKNVVLVISKQKKGIIKFFKNDKKIEQLIKGTNKEGLLEEWREIVENISIKFVYQSKKINGSAGAVYAARKTVKNNPFALLFGDDVYIHKKNQNPALKQMIETYKKTGKYVLGCARVDKNVVDRYGILIVGDNDCGYKLVKGVKEKPTKEEAPSNLASLGRYILMPSIFDNILKTEKHENGEVYLPEAIMMESENNNVVACELTAKYFDLGNKLEFIKCTIHEALKDDNIKGELERYLSELSIKF